MTPVERSLRARIAAHESWAHTPDRSARTSAARRAALDRFEREVDPDGQLTPHERAVRAEHARKAYFARLALRSVQARRRAAEVRARSHEFETLAGKLDADAESTEAELGALGGGKR
ncbi:hypothetical protein [Nocardia cyriacigeorgica]|uniref:hypothetical protein n=1 Tax=Nocardia cyriacigeorgica TaxID=135487 RepID=UPI002016F706|nr:hypothetical protein [Nocardia cyriacigeorgica]